MNRLTTQRKKEIETGLVGLHGTDVRAFKQITELLEEIDALLSERQQLIEKGKAAICYIPFHGFKETANTQPFIQALENLRQTLHKIENGKDR